MKVMILEGSRPNETGYHFTTLENLIKILNTDIMLATNPSVEVDAQNHVWRTDDSGKNISWSYTRKKDGMYYRNMNKTDSVRLKLDIDKISNNHKIFPFSWENLAKTDSAFEFEDRVVGQTWTDSSGKKVTGTKNITKYIKEISFSTYLKPSVKIAKFDAQTQEDLTVLDTFHYSVSSYSSDIDKLQSSFNTSDFFISILDNEAKLKEFLEKEYKNSHSDLFTFFNNLSKYLSFSKFSQVTTSTLENIDTFFEETEETQVFDSLNRLKRLTRHKFLIEDNSELFSELKSELKKLKGFSSKGTTLDELISDFRLYLNNKGIEFSFRNPSAEVDFDNLEKGILEKDTEVFIRKTIKSINDLTAQYKKLYDSYIKIKKRSMDFTEKHFDKSMSLFNQVLSDFVYSKNKRESDRLINSLKMNGKNYKIVIKDNNRYKYDLMFISSDKQLEFLNKNEYNDNYKWYILTEKEKHEYTSNMFEKDVYALLKALKIRGDNTVSGRQLSEYINKALTNSINFDIFVLNNGLVYRLSHYKSWFNKLNSSDRVIMEFSGRTTKVY